MIMFNKLPYFVILQGKRFKINVDFRHMISFENILQDKSISNQEKIEYLIRYFYPAFYNVENYNALLRLPDLYEEACDKLVWFYKGGRENYHKSKGDKKKSSEQIYSYEFDDEYIYGAFYEQYGIDLEKDRIHWWKFKALLKSLKDDTEFVKIKGYRAYTGKDNNMIELREYWTLPKSSTEQERLDRLYECLK